MSGDIPHFPADDAAEARAIVMNAVCQYDGVIDDPEGPSIEEQIYLDITKAVAAALRARDEEIARLRGEMKVMHRRAQVAEAAAMLTVEDCRRSSPHVNLRRALYAVAAKTAEERADEAIGLLRKIADYTQHPAACNSLPPNCCDWQGDLATAFLARVEKGKK